MVHSDPARRSPSVDCPGNCAQRYSFGTVVEVTAVPEPGLQFDGCGLACTGTDPVIQVTMDSAKTCRANFSPAPAGFTLTVSILGNLDGGGRIVAAQPAGAGSAIDCPGVCTETFAPGTEEILEYAHVPGTFFAGWFVCENVSLQNQCEVVMDADKSISAFYE